MTPPSLSTIPTSHLSLKTCLGMGATISISFICQCMRHFPDALLFKTYFKFISKHFSNDVPSLSSNPQGFFFFFLHNVLNTSSSPQRVKIVTGITKYEGSFTLLGFDKFN